MEKKLSKVTTIRIPVGLYDIINTRSRKQLRSLNSYIVNALMKYVEYDKTKSQSDNLIDIKTEG